jgi:hypothetical protein
MPMFSNDPWKLAASMWKNALALQETASASGAVIRHRRATIDAAIRNPAGADLAELGRMVPEKLAAFSDAGGSLLRDCLALQSDCLAQMQDLSLLALAGRVPSAAAMERVSRRGARIMTRATAAGGRALAPIHKTATANDRRLGKVRNV